VRGHFTPGQTHDAVADKLQISVGRRISFTVTTGAVVSEAVELDHQPARRPDCVDLVDVVLTLEQNIEERAAQSACIEQCLKPVL
jgi:hypothetical protein